MSRNLVASVIIACAGATAGAAANQSSSTVPSGCSSSDQKLMASYTEAGIKALLTGNLNRYQSISRELETRLSSSCLAAFARLQPAKTKCSADEKQEIIDHYDSIMKAIWNGEVMRIFPLLDDLEESVSAQCWLALNYPQDSRILQACDSGELAQIASIAGPSNRITQRLLMGDLSQLSNLFGLLQNLDARLSESCKVAVVQVQQEAQLKQAHINQQHGSSGGTRQYQPSQVQDHGGGVYSMPSLGVACGPSGCVK
jgi:hypothetical protein